MHSNSLMNLKDRMSAITLFIKKGYSQVAALGNNRIRKFYADMLESIGSYQEILLDENGNVLTWNSKFKKLEGYNEDEIIGQSHNLFYLPSDRQSRLPEHLLEEAILKGKSRYFGQFVSKEGSTFWGKIILTAIKNNSEVLGFLVECRESKSHY